MIISYNTPDDDPPAGGSGGDGENNAAPTENKGTLILDATCALQQIALPQDINLLNEARENLEILIDDICSEFKYYKPRMYRRNARRELFGRCYDMAKNGEEKFDVINRIIIMAEKCMV